MEKQEIVDAYLQFLNIEKQNLSCEFLAEITKKHVAAFPFTSVHCLLGGDLPLDTQSLFERIVLEKRGGYCFEHNSLVFDILDQLGFSPKLYLGRVINALGDSGTTEHTPLTHRLTIVEIDDVEYVVDVSFGFQGPTIPVPLDGEIVQDGMRQFRVEKQNDTDFHFQILKNGNFMSLYRFELASYGQADCEVGHFFSYKNPDSLFLNRLIGSVIKEDNKIHSLLDLEYRIISDSETEIKQVQSAQELQTILVDALELKVSENQSQLLFDKFAK